MGSASNKSDNSGSDAGSPCSYKSPAFKVTDSIEVDAAIESLEGSIEGEDEAESENDGDLDTIEVPSERAAEPGINLPPSLAAARLSYDQIDNVLRKVADRQALIKAALIKAALAHL